MKSIQQRRISLELGFLLISIIVHVIYVVGTFLNYEDGYRLMAYNSVNVNDYHFAISAFLSWLPFVFLIITLISLIFYVTKKHYSWILLYILLNLFVPFIGAILAGEMWFNFFELFLYQISHYKLYIIFIIATCIVNVVKRKVYEKK